MADEGGDNYTGSDNVPSGAYIFKPSINNTQSLPYFTNPPIIESYNCDFMQEIVFYFNDHNKRMGRVIMRAFDKDPMLQFDVHLAPIPPDESGFGGKEVTVNFNAYNLTHKVKFYTDSNALEMQERIKDFRTDWNLTTN